MFECNLEKFPKCNSALLKQINCVMHDWQQGGTTFQQENLDFKTSIDVDEIIHGEIPMALAEKLRELDPVSELVRKLCWRYLPMPPESLLDLELIEEWNIGLQYMSVSNSSEQKGFQQFRRDVRPMTIQEYLHAQIEYKSTPVYESVKYIGKIKSFAFLKRWLNFQFTDPGKNS